MYKRNIEPLIEFMKKNPEAGTWCVDCGYGKLYYYNKDVSCTISARLDACGSTVLVEVEDEQDEICEHPSAEPQDGVEMQTE